MSSTYTSRYSVLSDDGRCLLMKLSKARITYTFVNAMANGHPGTIPQFGWISGDATPLRQMVCGSLYSTRANRLSCLEKLRSCALSSSSLCLMH